MFENTPSARVQLVGLGELLSPACCMICGNGNCEHGYARLGVFYDYEGEQYICRTCVVQVAELFDCLTPEEAREQHAIATDNAAKLTAALNELQVLRERLTVFDAAMASIASSSSSISDSFGDPADPGESDSDNLIGEPLNSGEGDEPESPESVKESGRADASQPPAPDVTKPADGISL